VLLLGGNPVAANGLDTDAVPSLCRLSETAFALPGLTGEIESFFEAEELDGTEEASTGPKENELVLVGSIGSCIEVGLVDGAPKENFDGSSFRFSALCLGFRP
jgi:hypothetical protein